MARRETVLQLPVGCARALAACEAAIGALGWELERRGPELVGYEDPARLCCRDSPVSAVLTVAPAGDEASELRVEMSVAGRGPLAARSLRTRLRALAVQIGRELGPGLGTAVDPDRACNAAPRG